jgi:hypothetical protein
MNLKEVKHMDSEVYSFALKNTLNEIREVCPGIKNLFIFRENGEILAGDENTAEESIVRGIDALDGMLEKAEAMDGVERMVFEGSKGRLNVSHMNELYIVTITGKGVDVDYVGDITQILVSTVLKLVKKISPASTDSDLDEPEKEPEESIVEHVEEDTEELTGEPETKEQEEHEESETEPESILPKAEVNQFIVENLSGLFVPGDTVRVDNDILLKWKEMYENRRIEQVEIETFGGKSARCKLKPIKDAKYEGKGVIQTPEKIQTILEIRKGELVRVKPVIE